MKDKFYTFSRVNRIPAIEFDEDRLSELSAHIKDSVTCLEEDWSLAHDCMNIIEEYEYLLFASLLSGSEKYKKEYLSLRERISIVNAGQFSEYYEGNIYLLALTGLIDFRDYDLGGLMTHTPLDEEGRHCY